MRDIPRHKFLILRWRCILYLKGYCDQEFEYRITNLRDQLISWFLSLAFIARIGYRIIRKRFTVPSNYYLAFASINVHHWFRLIYLRSVYVQITQIILLTRKGRFGTLFRCSSFSWTGSFVSSFCCSIFVFQGCWNYFYHKITRSTKTQRL